MLAILGFVVLLVFFARNIIQDWWTPAFWLPIILVGFHQYAKLRTQLKVIIIGLMLGLIAVYADQLMTTVRLSLASPPVWDVQAFWLDGQVAAHGYNFYITDYYHQLAVPLNPDEAFTVEVLDAGFPYPPPTMFLFLPLGLFDIFTATRVWYALLCLILVVDIILIWKCFKTSDNWLTLGLVALLTLAFAPVQKTFALGQTNLILLFTLLMLWRSARKPISGLWLLLGTLVKPFVGVLLLYPLLARHWRSLLVAIIGGVIISIITIVVFTPVTFLSYITENPLSKKPISIYAESGNASLLAVLRHSGVDLQQGDPLRRPEFIISAMLLVAATVALTYQLNAQYSSWVLALLIPLALLIYPSTGDHYAVILLPGLLLLWQHRSALPGGVHAAVAFIVIEFLILRIRGGDYAVFGLLLNWIVFAAVIWKQRPLPDLQFQTLSTE